MEPIQASLKKWMRENKSFQDNFNHMKRELLSDSEISPIVAEHPELDLDRNLIKLYEYKTQSKNCEDCPSLQACKNILPGYTPHYQVQGKDIHLTYDKCRQKLQHEEQQSKQKLVNSLYMPKDILEASMEGLDHHVVERRNAIQEVATYLESLGTKKAEKGLYLYGPFGVGKTYFLGAIANKLADRNISSTLIYMPEFVREIKSSLKDDSLNQKIDYFKKVKVLMLDDIGAESISSWFRDEILGSILQYRMMERLPVFFSSNYSLEQLEQHLATSNRGDTETLKAGRIIERIKQVSKEVPLFGDNRRDQS
ncbi:primosomal protein DnaI [Aquibacillus koreensis]|uniref:Primosomal protein DnaI n=1 Tax=Aquibacillus koreensis TaxID=279446 RepID=A0A9X4AIC0_9BACI|nr:primosomal protein DnaI [Aquibacillus koreensis]MCT2537198.1 primosomal protein DnaI [Aquibacillus koreensis]MDC3419230.1 primosomal protein DnaI [Aquibacillus koreensis]